MNSVELKRRICEEERKEEKNKSGDAKQQELSPLNFYSASVTENKQGKRGAAKAHRGAHQRSRRGREQGGATVTARRLRSGVNIVAIPATTSVSSTLSEAAK
jgi:hypothetical protein